jgi:peptidoglycan hydrolase-like protein with peptidoglycan-binding domain
MLAVAIVLVATVPFTAWGRPTSGPFMESRHGVSDEKAGWKVAAYTGGSPNSSVLAPSQLATTTFIPSCNWVFDVQEAFVPGTYPTLSDPYRCNLRRGDTGDGVRQLQNSMDICYHENLATDGVFGPLTEAALIRTQRTAGTTVDGVYGPNTRRAMLHQKDSGMSCKRVTI